MDFYSPLRLKVRAQAITFILGAALASSAYADKGPNIFPLGNFEAVQPSYVPWAGVDPNGNLHGLDGVQISVGDDGGIRNNTPFGPSIGVADMNGDEKPDIVMADTKGFFWLYLNSGTKDKPVFTTGEVIPIWLGEEPLTGAREGYDNVVPRLQVVDLTGAKKFDIVAGTYAGKFYRIPNIGSGSQPNYKPTVDRDHLLVNTHKRGVLWCNYLAPYLTSAFNGSISSQLDLVMGEGTYSANSIYLLHNIGSNDQPAFDEDHFKKIIPGYGLEQIAPVVIDWDNDGKPDVIAGSRTGNIVLYKNTSTDPANPTFDPGVNIKIGGQEKLGFSVTIAVCDLTGNKLPNLLIGRNDGTISYALNTGTLGNPQFTTPLSPIKGTFPANYRDTEPTQWQKEGMWGVPDEVLSCVNPTNEPGFTFPDGVAAKYALKFQVWPIKNVFFPVRYYPPSEEEINEHRIVCRQGVKLKLNTSYRLHYWVRSEGSVQNMRLHLHPVNTDDPPNFEDIIRNESPSTGWHEVDEDIRVSNQPHKDLTEWDYYVEFRFNGQTTFYICDLEIQEVK